jgi:hypothetical protein
MVSELMGKCETKSQVSFDQIGVIHNPPLITDYATTRNRCGAAVLSHQRIGRLIKEVDSLRQMGCFSDIIEGVNGSSASW